MSKHERDLLAQSTQSAAAGAKKYYRDMHHRIFVNRSLHLDKIEFFGFDMDYTLAEYKSPHMETLFFDLAKNHLITEGYPQPIAEYQFDPSFIIRGLWFDVKHGNLLKVDPYGNILVCVHGFTFLKTSEIYDRYPNKFIKKDETRIEALDTMFALPQYYLVACVIDYFSNSTEYESAHDGIRLKNSELFMSYSSIYNDVIRCFDWCHDEGAPKEIILEDMDKYLQKDDRIAMLFDRLRENKKKTFLLTNSPYPYTNAVMKFLYDVPSAHGRPWQSFFDYIVVDARKPSFFGEGTILRQVNVETGKLSLGTHLGPFKKGQVYSGGNCDVFTQLIGAKGRDVLYVGDHIYGDILKSKKTRGWRTFLCVPELQRELYVWTSKRVLFDHLLDYDIEMGELYKNLDSSCTTKPDIAKLTNNIRQVTHELDLNYGILGSIFRCGSRQTNFASQITRYADIYAHSFLNLIYYPFFYMFRAPAMLMPHESTVEPIISEFDSVDSQQEKIEMQRPSSLSERRHSSSLAHTFPETPTAVTHHHDTDEESE